MKNTIIILDSSSGLDAQKAKEIGFEFLPLQVDIDGTTYKDGIDIKSDNLFNIFTLDSKVAKTSSTPLGYIQNLFEKLSNEYENVVYFPISTHLSSQYKIAKNLESEIKNLHVIESQDIACLITIKAFRLKALLEQGMNTKQAVAEVQKWDENFDVTLIPKYNDYLVKGGRLHPAAAALAKLFKIVPLIKFEKGQLLKEGKGRVFLKAVFNSIDDKASKVDNLKDYDFILLHSNNSEISKVKQYIQEKYNLDVYTGNIPSVVSIHTGPEAIVVILTKKIAPEVKAVL
ncbi:DegV family protein [Mycoplasmopsis gallinacea]|uniref:DegV family EDD domain-containing protein n=1 Tax=Mycoplasmopsis gallinacea TaxID=29556 RepID=A0A6H0V4T7_9BACT|nr:DegV family protein [Mycoplasmopsis gallinacea]QIW62037.1 DegV family EDD domain-containing protein [Mycoplasmopsis gallinacea]